MNFDNNYIIYRLCRDRTIDRLDKLTPLIGEIQQKLILGSEIRYYDFLRMFSFEKVRKFITKFVMVQRGGRRGGIGIIGGRLGCEPPYPARKPRWLLRSCPAVQFPEAIPRYYLNFPGRLGTRLKLICHLLFIGSSCIQWARMIHIAHFIRKPS